MDVKKILFDYVVENESFSSFPLLEKAEEQLISSLTDKQKELFEKYTAQYSSYYNDRIYYYFCKGLEAKIKAD